jgi:hypothetical protein
MEHVGAVDAGSKGASALTAYYFGDEHTLNTLGLKLIAGRNFTADEIANRTETDIGAIDSVIVTKALADKVFPGGDALGKSIFIESDQVGAHRRHRRAPADAILWRHRRG